MPAAKGGARDAFGGARGRAGRGERTLGEARRRGRGGETGSGAPRAGWNVRRATRGRRRRRRGDEGEVRAVCWRGEGRGRVLACAPGGVATAHAVDAAVAALARAGHVLKDGAQRACQLGPVAQRLHPLDHHLLLHLLLGRRDALDPRRSLLAAAARRRHVVRSRGLLELGDEREQLGHHTVSHHAIRRRALDAGVALVPPEPLLHLVMERRVPANRRKGVERDARLALAGRGLGGGAAHNTKSMSPM